MSAMVSSTTYSSMCDTCVGFSICYPTTWGNSTWISSPELECRKMNTEKQNLGKISRLHSPYSVHKSLILAYRCYNTPLHILTNLWNTECVNTTILTDVYGSTVDVMVPENKPSVCVWKKRFWLSQSQCEVQWGGYLKTRPNGRAATWLSCLISRGWWSDGP